MACQQSASHQPPTTTHSRHQNLTQKQSFANITSTVVTNDLAACKKLLSLLQSCFGPYAKKQSIGNPDTVRAFTSISSRLFHNLNIKNPFNSLLRGGVQVQTDHHKDGGCLLAILTLQLVLIWRDDDDGKGDGALPTALASEMLEFLVDNLMNFSREKLTFNLDVTSCKDLAAIVQSVLTSNWIFFNADSSQLDHFVALILRVFVSGVRTADGDQDGASFSMPEIQYRHVNGLDLRESKLEEGLFVPAPMDWEDPRSCSSGHWVAIFDISLSGDSDEFVSSTSASETYATSRFVDVQAFLEKAVQFFDHLIDEFNVTMILCQRVIHPFLQSHLRSRHVTFIQRLSSDSTPFICRLSGAKLFSSVIRPAIDTLKDRIGRLKSVIRVRLPDEKEYLHLMGYGYEGCDSVSSFSSSSSSSSIQTFVVCSPTEENYLETKSLIEASLSTLKSAVNSPSFVDGGGCFLARLQTYLTCHSKWLADRMMSELGLPTKLLAQRGIDAVTKALKLTLKAMTSTEVRLMSIVDGSRGHHWILDTNEMDGCTIRCVCRKMVGNWSVTEDKLLKVEDFRLLNDELCEKRLGFLVDSSLVVSSAIRSSFQLAAILIHTEKVIAAR